MLWASVRAREAPRRYGFCGENGQHCIEEAAAPWQEIQRAAEEFYDRTSACRFTSFVGYEWSGNPDSKMTHRNVVFRNERVPPPIEFTSTSPRTRFGKSCAVWIATPPLNECTMSTTLCSSPTVSQNKSTQRA